jgi:peptidoglycan-N-acetylglucosamine deacetylase
MTRPIASISLDMDNQWSYMKTHGDPDWKSLPSYFDQLIPHLLATFGPRRWSVTFFVVGSDCQSAANRDALGALVKAGHNFGNHSLYHEPWLHLYSRAALENEIARAEEAIASVTGVQPTGFRGPGFSWSAPLLETLAARGYHYDASSLPSWIGPLARRYYFWTAHLSAEQCRERQQLFGTLRDAWRPLRPYRWQIGDGHLLEIPVTTMPLTRVPFHLSYILYLSRFSPRLARLYFRTALRLCRLTGVEPSLLLHPLDFLGGDEVQALAFFPAMNLPGHEKRRRIAGYLDDLAATFDVLSLGQHAALLATRPNLRRITPDAAPETAGAGGDSEHRGSTGEMSASGAVSTR